MTTKDDNKRIEDLAEKIKKLEAQKKQLEARTKEKERKARTRRLIQVGAIIESMGIPNEDIAKKFKDYFENNPTAKDFLQKIILEVRK